MRIVRCDRSHDAGWNQFVHACPRASFYHRAEWRDINERCFGHRTAFLAALDGDRFVGVFPLVQLKSVLFGNVACSMPFVNYGGPAAESEAIQQQLLDAGAEVADDWRVNYVEIRSQRHLGERYPSAEHKVSMTVELDSNPELLWNAFQGDHRKEIRRAYKNGFTARFGPELLDDFYAVLTESWRDLGTPIYRASYLESVLRAFPDAYQLCVVYAADGQPAAGALSGVHRGTVEGMWLGMRNAYRRELVGYVLYWEIIKDACERGYRRFHLGRSSKDSGGEQFKRKWNADAVQLYWQYILRTRADIPALNVSNPKYQMAIRAWRRLPLTMTRFIGPLLARSIP
jgi:FemAB-related protein (PEP-CTERM system-associated)